MAEPKHHRLLRRLDTLKWTGAYLYWKRQLSSGIGASILQIWTRLAENRQFACLVGRLLFLLVRLKECVCYFSVYMA